MNKKYKRPDSVNIWVNHYSDMGRSELNVIMKNYIATSDQHHAAAILIDEIDKKTEENEGKKHKELVTISKITLLISAIAAASAIFAAFYAKTQAESALISARLALQNQSVHNKIQSNK